MLALADGNLANFLWDGERCRVVDLEDSGASDRAYELADHVEHITFRVAGRAIPTGWRPPPACPTTTARAGRRTAGSSPASGW